MREFVCKLFVFVGTWVIDCEKYGTILIEEPWGTETMFFVYYWLTLWFEYCVLKSMQSCVMCIFVLVRLYCGRLVWIGGFGGLESVLEVTILGEILVCTVLMLNVGGMFVSVVFCAGVNEYAVTFRSPRRLNCKMLTSNTCRNIYDISRRSSWLVTSRRSNCIQFRWKKRIIVSGCYRLRLYRWLCFSRISCR